MDELLKMLEESDAAVMSIVPRRGDESIIGGIFVTNDEALVLRLLECVEKYEAEGETESDEGADRAKGGR